MKSIKTLRSKGKLLLTGEYTVLDGAKALAVPTQLGQSLQIHISEKNNNKITWFAYKNNGELWFTTTLDLRNNKVENNNNPELSKNLLQIFQEVKNLNSSLFKDNFGYECETQLEFPQDWGLGSSSTLINNIAKWAKVNPYNLLAATFGGSGYDVACADSNTPIIYQLRKDQLPLVSEAYLSADITDNLLFIYRNKKQNSREGIARYKQKTKSDELIKKISEITEKVSNPKCSFQEFSFFMTKHEKYISEFIEIQTVKDDLFSDYSGFIKSLGAWGGDFIMAEKKEGAEEYFKDKGYKIVKKYDELLI